MWYRCSNRIAAMGILLGISTALSATPLFLQGHKLVYVDDSEWWSEPTLAIRTYVDLSSVRHVKNKRFADITLVNVYSVHDKGNRVDEETFAFNCSDHSSLGHGGGDGAEQVRGGEYTKSGKVLRTEVYRVSKLTAEFSRSNSGRAALYMDVVCRTTR